jgi:hypothetical protein
MQAWISEKMANGISNKNNYFQTSSQIGYDDA